MCGTTIHCGTLAYGEGCVLEVFFEEPEVELFTLSFYDLGESRRATEENMDFPFLFFGQFLKELQEKKTTEVKDLFWPSLCVSP